VLPATATVVCRGEVPWGTEDGLQAAATGLQPEPLSTVVSGRHERRRLRIDEACLVVVGISVRLGDIPFNRWVGLREAVSASRCLGLVARFVIAVCLKPDSGLGRSCLLMISAYIDAVGLSWRRATTPCSRGPPMPRNV
jgi:hypothetical protein